MESALDAVRETRKGVRRAIEGWDGAGIYRIQICIEFLEESVVKLHSAEQLVRKCRPEAREGLAAAVLGLKQDIARLSRVVDAGASFYRGLAQRLGAEQLAYTATGELAENGTPGASESLEG